MLPAINIMNTLYQLPNANSIKSRLLELVQIHGLRENRQSDLKNYHRNTLANESSEHGRLLYLQALFILSPRTIVKRCMCVVSCYHPLGA